MKRGSGSGSGFINSVAKGALSNAITQGVGVATGLQKKFDWAGVAVAGVGSAVSWAGGKLGVEALGATKDGSGARVEGNLTFGNIAANGLQGIARAIAGSATRSLINGSDFGDNLVSALPDAIGTTIGEALGAWGEQELHEAAQQREKVKADPIINIDLRSPRQKLLESLGIMSFAPSDNGGFVAPNDGFTVGPAMSGYPDPPAASLQTGDGSASGGYNTEEPTVGDYLTRGIIIDGAALAGPAGYPQASSNLLHYMRETGSTKRVSIAALLGDPESRASLTLNELRQGQIARAYEWYSAIGGRRDMTFTLQTPWDNFTAKRNTDWFYALGTASMSIESRFTFTRTKTGLTLRVDTRADVFDRYNWDGSKMVRILGMKVTDKQLGRMETVGFARTYANRGSAFVKSINIDASWLIKNGK